MLPSPHKNMANTLHVLGRAHLAAGDAATAESTLRASLQNMNELPETHWQIGEVKSLLGAALIARDRRSEGLALLEEGRRIVAEHLGPDASASVAATRRLDEARGEGGG